MSEPVTLLRRFGAIAYDAMLVGGSILIIGGILSTILAHLLGVDYLEPGSLAARLMTTVYFLMGFGFFGWFWTHGGQTLGMRAWKIRVVTYSGQPLDWQQAFFRYMAAIISWLFLGAGFFAALLDAERLTWHDRFSRTRLIRVD